jgi:hypothetical protein
MGLVYIKSSLVPIFFLGAYPLLYGCNIRFDFMATSPKEKRNPKAIGSPCLHRVCIRDRYKGCHRGLHRDRHHIGKPILKPRQATDTRWQTLPHTFHCACKTYYVKCMNCIRLCMEGIPLYVANKQQGMVHRSGIV